MNKIDEIRVKLEECSREKDRWSNKLIDTDDVLEIIAPYLSHGITEEEARKWYRNLPTDPNQIEFMTEGNDLGLITSSREPIAEPEHTIHTLAEDQKDLDSAVNKMVDDKFWELLEDKPKEMSKKEELLNRIALVTDCLCDAITDKELEWIYDEIRASILTPKVVALLKAIGNRPDFCGVCKWSRCIPISGDRYRLGCKIQNLNTQVTDFRDTSDEWFKKCPLLSSEELKELTE